MTSDPDQEFEELCALSTTGELTAEEWARHTGHLAHCESCREAGRQYERLIGTTISALGAESSAEEDGENAPGSWSVKEAEATLMEALRREPAPRVTPPAAHPAADPAPGRWKHALRFTAAAVILAACSTAGYRIGIHRGHESASASASAGPTGSRIQPYLNPPVGTNSAAQENRTAPAVDQAAALRKQARLERGEIASLNDLLNKAESEMADRSADLDRSVEERADLDKKLAEAQSNALSLEARLSLIGKETSED